MPVLDASVLAEYLAGAEHAAAAREWVLGTGEPLWAPHLVDAEVGHVLRRAVSARQLDAAAAAVALTDLADMPLRRAAHTGLLERSWALRDNVSFYDGLYVALAERIGIPLVTFDARLARAPGVAAVIEVLP